VPPLTATLISRVTPLARSRTNTSLSPFESLLTRFNALLANATNCPLEETLGWLELSSPPPKPERLTLTSSVVPAARSLANTSRNGPMSSFVTRLLA
jgi:hypothetical protein